MEGRQLSQLPACATEYGERYEQLGVFNPRLVTHQTRKLMRDDPQVAFALAILRAPVINMKWSVESRDPEIAAFVEHVLRPTYRQLALAGTLAVPFGNQVIEKVWKAKSVETERRDQRIGDPIKTGHPMAWIIEKFRAIPHETITFLIDEQKDEWAGIEQTRSDGQNVKVGKANAALWSFRRQDVWGELTGYPILNQCYEPWWWKAVTSLYANRYYERKADPPMMGRPAPTVKKGGKDTCGFQFMTDQYLALRSGGLMMLPNLRNRKGDYLWDAQFLMDDKRGDMLQARLDALDVQIARALWITDRAGTTGTVGAKAEAVVHAETLAGSLEMILNEWVDEVCNPQVVDDIVRFNYGQAAVDSSNTRLKIAGLSASQRDMLKELLANLLQAEAMQLGGKQVKLADVIDSDGILDELEIPKKSADELKEMAGTVEPEPEPNAGVFGDNELQPTPDDEAALLEGGQLPGSDEGGEEGQPFKE